MLLYIHFYIFHINLSFLKHGGFSCCIITDNDSFNSGVLAVTMIRIKEEENAVISDILTVGC